MNVIVDIGNTRVKVAIFNANSLKELLFFDHSEWVNYVRSLDSYSLIISNVGLSNDLVRSKFPDAIYLSHKLNFDFKNLYETPETLGVDRIALVVGSRCISESNRLIIDLGSCITFDFVNKQNEYLGGAISPGLKMRAKAMHNFTSKLPLIDQVSESSLIGNTTQTALKSGLYHGILNEIKGSINAYENKFGEIDVILTGGDAKIFDSKIKRPIFVAPELALEGLNKILQDNS